jgi:pteridine reductase
MTQPRPDNLDGSVALITGAARRLGEAIARELHGAGANVVVHYHTSAADAQRLTQALNELRPASAIAARADVLDTQALSALIDHSVAAWGHLDILVNNASTFYPTPFGTVTEEQWDDLLGSNLKSPFFLCQAAAPHLTARRGCIVNMVDVNALSPLAAFPAYSIAKAGLYTLTQSLAKELGPLVRVNGVAPGTILWPELDQAEDERQRLITNTALKRRGDPREIARAVLFLARDATYTTGHVITVDGGRHLYI